MNKVSELNAILSKSFNWHKSRMNCLTQILIALFTVKTVNLRELAVAMVSKTQINSREQRLYRFFAHFKIDSFQIASWLYKLFVANGEKVYIAIDRTNWFWGKSAINIFMLSICFEGIAIPILWRVLPKDGTSSGKEQIALCQRFVDGFGDDCIEGLLADREFANKQFITWLDSLEIPFYIRVKGDSMISIKGRKWQKASYVFSDVKPYKTKVFGMRSEVFGGKYYLTASRNERGELMIIVTNADYKNAIAIYLRRWEIESLFQALKGRGFRFEETHMTYPERIEKMIVILAIGFAWAHKVGEWRAKLKPIRLKKFNNQLRPQYSYFRYGLDFIRDAFTGLILNKKSIKKCFNLLKIAQQEVLI